MKFKLSAGTELTTAMISRIFSKSQADLNRLENLEDYYRGNHKILSKTVTDASKPNNKVVHPYGQYITDTLTGYLCGEAITYSSLDEDALNELNMILQYNDAAAEDMSIAHNMSVYGVAYEMLYIDEDGNIRFASVSPLEIIPVYDDTIEENLLYIIRKIPEYDIMTDRKTYRIEVYDSKEVKIYKTSELFAGLSFVESAPHYFNDVPFVEYRNNADMTGDFESVISLIDAYDTLTSDSLDDYDYFVDAYMLLTGVTADSEDIAAMKQNRVLLLDEDAKAEFLTKSTEDTTIENLKSRTQKDIHKFAKVPDLSDENFAANASGIAIKFKLYGTETLCSKKESYMIKGLQRRIELIYNIIALKGTSYDFRAIDIVFGRAIPTNESEIADVIQKLSGIVSTETLLAQVPFVKNVEAEKERITRDKEQNPFYDLDVEAAVEEGE